MIQCGVRRLKRRNQVNAVVVEMRWRAKRWYRMEVQVNVKGRIRLCDKVSIAAALESVSLALNV